MKKYLVASIGILALLLPGVASAHFVHPTPRHVGVYKYVRRHDIAKFGKLDPGRNIVKYGLANGKPASDAQVVASTHVMERELYPPKPVVYHDATPVAAPVASAPTPPATATVASGGGYTIPSSIVQCESGGNYSAVNPSSGAGGAYQILPSTWQAYGGQGLPQNASPAEQGHIAAEIMAKQGPSAWTCK